ncbi:hypothetical protein V5O48_018589, partial [Marasmius crinis-equi]
SGGLEQMPLPAPPEKEAISYLIPAVILAVLQKRETSSQRIAAVEDKLALKAIENQALRPDLAVDAPQEKVAAASQKDRLSATNKNTGARSRRISAQKGEMSEPSKKPINPVEVGLPPVAAIPGEASPSPPGTAPSITVDIDELDSEEDYVPSEADELKPADMELDDDAVKALVDDIDLEIEDDAAYQQFVAMRNAAKASHAKNLKRKETQAKKKEAKTAQKSKIRHAIASARKVPSAAVDGRKRALSEAEEKGSDPKKSKSADPALKGKSVEEVGGLRKNYQSIYQQASAASSRSSIQSDSSQAGEDLVGGVFDDDDDNMALAMARDAKKRRQESETVFMQAIRKAENVPANPVKLVDADVNNIDVKESTHATPTQTQPTPRKTVSIRDLPISAADFAKNFLPVILDFVGTQENQFGVSSNPDLPPFIRKQFNIIFPDHSPIDDALVKLLTRVVLGEICEYRTKVGKLAMSIVKRDVESHATLEERQSYVEGELSEDAWLYEEPGETRASSKGTMRGPGLLETFSHHRRITRHVAESMKMLYGNPSGALALSAAAYLRALTAWESGHDSIAAAQRLAKQERNGRLSKNNEHSFSEDLWASSVTKYYNIVKNASLNKWKTILESADTVIAALGETAATGQADDSAPTPQNPDMIVMSD